MGTNANRGGPVGGRPRRDSSVALRAEVAALRARNAELEAMVGGAPSASALSSLESLWRAFHLSPAPTSLLSFESGRFLDVNAAFAELVGYSRDELLAMSATEARLGVDGRHREHVLALRGGAAPFRGIEVEMRRKDGSTVTCLTSIELVEMGGMTCLVGMFVDLSEFRRAEASRRESEAHARETHRMESLAVLAGGAAHDFNNLLTAITLNANLALAETGDDGPGARHLRAIELAAARAGALTRQMLAYAGEAAATLEPVDLSVVAREALTLVEVSLGPNARIETDFGAELPLVEADASQLRQVVMNLLTNASEALGDAPGTISLRTDEGEMTAAQLKDCQLGGDAAPGRFVFVEVGDTGHGMEAATRGRIFDPFFSTKFTGRGLGLAGVAGIVRAHAGAIRVESAPGAGSRFTVFIPVTGAVQSAVVAPPGESPAWSGHGVVMVVDDDDTVRAMTGRLLERAGFDVIAARDGVAAVELFAANNSTVRMVVLDMTMPRMDGEETLRALRTVEPNVRVLLASGHSEEETAARVAEAVPDGFIQKPYTGRALLERMRAVLGE